MGFQKVHEIVPGRHYEVWADQRHFRILISRTIVGSSEMPWNSAIDECVQIRPDPESSLFHVWTTPQDILKRMLGDNPRMALFLAMQYLAEAAGVDSASRIRAEQKRRDV